MAQERQVQTHATRLVKGLEKLPYEERLKEIRRLTLLYRRERAEMVKFFKIMEIIDQVNLKYLNVKHLDENSSTITRGHKTVELKNRHFKHKSTMNSFIPQCTNNWNALPITV